MTEDGNDVNTPPALSNIDTSQSASSESSHDDSPSRLDLNWTPDETWNVNWALQFSRAFSTPSCYVHADMTENASTALQPPISSASVDDSMPSTRHGGMQEAPSLPGNDVRTSGATSNLHWNMEYHQADRPLSSCLLARMSQYRVAGFKAPVSTGNDSATVLEPMERCLEIKEESVTLRNSVTNRGGAYNVEPVLEYGEAFSHVSTYATVTENSGLPVPASSGGACHSIPSTSRGSIEEIIQGYDARDATHSTQSENRQDISGVHGDVNRAKRSSGEQRNKCDICDKSFTMKSNLARHRRAHTVVKPYHCGICDKSFSQNYNLARHSRTHTGDKPYYCVICGKSFIQKQHLAAHRPTHTGEKPYHCSICGQSFVQKYNLKVHSRTHTGEKPIKCTIGTKSFADPGNRRAHERTHRGDKSYKCEMCAHSSKTSSDLKTHQRTHRGEDT